MPALPSQAHSHAHPLTGTIWTRQFTSLGCGRKPGFPERTQVDVGRMCKLHPDSGPNRELFFFFSSSILQWNDIELNSIHYSRTSCTLSSLFPPPTASYKAGVPSPGLPILKCLREQIQVSESSVLFKYLAEPTLIRIRNIQVNCLLQCYYSLPSISIKKKKKKLHLA